MVFLSRLGGASELRIEGDGTDLRLAVAGRRWINSDGRRNMPSGEVFTDLGRSYRETRGTNESAIHWDLICDLRAGGCLTADSAAILVDGRLV